MNAATYPQAPAQRKLMGWAWVVGLHALLLAALQAGLDRTVVQNLPTVVQALLLEDQRPDMRSEPRPEPAKAMPPPVLKPPTPTVKTPPPSPAPTVVEPVVAPPVASPANAIAAVNNPPAPVSASAAPVPASATATPTAAAKPAAPARTTANVNMAQCEKPAYPSASRSMEEEGTVALRFLVGVDGKIVQSEIEKSSGYKRLDEAARAGLSKCQFKPATVDGKPEQAWTTIRYVWRLD